MEQQMTTREMKRVKRKKRQGALLLLFLLLLLAAVAAWYFTRPAETEDGPDFAPNASVGALPGRSREEIEAMLDQKITENTVAYTVNAAPVFENGTAKGNLMLESPANNINYIEFVISLDETGEVLYRSGLLKPNQYITEDYLLVELEAGSYPCTVDITLYDPETLEAKGMTQAGITLTVKQ